MNLQTQVPIRINELPLISVLMPAYNAERDIAEAIESVLNQTYQNFEFIIINDASTDNTLKIIEDYAKKDKRIKIINNEFNLKMCGSLNKGLRMTRGKYIARMDSDDICLPSRFEEQVRYLESHLDVGVVGAFIEIFDDETRKVTGIRKYSNDDKELRKKIFFYSPFAHPVTMIRKKVFENVGVYRKSTMPSEDLEFWFRVGRKYKFGNIQKVLLKYRVRNKSMTFGSLKKSEKNANKIRWRYCRDDAYKFGVLPFLYNLFHLISLYTVPSRFKVWLFSTFRDSK